MAWLDGFGGFSLGSFSLGAIAGAIAKAALEALVKRRAEKQESRRKAVREEISGALQKVSTCLDVAAKYYAVDSPSERAKLSRELRHATRTLGMQFNQVNLGLAALDLRPIHSELMVAFRRALTLHLDDAALPACDPQHQIVVDIYMRAYELQSALSGLRFDAVV